MTDHDKLREAIETAYFYPGSGLVETTGAKWALILAAAEKHLATLPKTKMVEVWHLEWVAKIDGQNIPQISVHTDKVAAERWRDCQQNALACIGYSCVRVTGPHQQEVPA